MKALRAAFVVASVALLSHSPALRDGFALDDSAAIVLNDTVSRRFSLGATFSTDYWGRDRARNRRTEAYRPLVSLSYALDWRLGRGAPWVFHLENIALHALLCGLLLLYLARRTGSLVGPSVGALFLAVHPMTTDAVTAVVGRADLLSTLWVMALFALHSSAMGPARVLAPMALLAAVLCKESALAALPVLGLTDTVKSLSLCPEALSPRERAVRWVGYLTALALAVALRARVLGLLALSPTDAQHNPLAVEGLVTRLATSLATLSRAARLTLCPTELLPDYGPSVIRVQTSLDFAVFSGLFVLLATIAACLPLGEADAPARRLRTTAGLWLVMVALASTNALAVLPRAFAERWWYGALVALSVLLALGVNRAARRFGAAKIWVLFAPVVVIFAALTARRAEVWRSDEALFADAVRTAPESGLAQLGLGRIRLAQGRGPEALWRCTRAVILCPGWSEALACRAMALDALGRSAEAEVAFRAMRASGQGLDGRLAYARFLARRGRIAEARAELGLLRREGRWTRRGYGRIGLLERELGP